MPRHTAYAELPGLSNAQRAAGVTAANGALDGEQVGEVTERQVIQDYNGKFGTSLLLNTAFLSEQGGNRIFNAMYDWARTRTTTPGATVRNVTYDENAGTITTWQSSAPDWPVAVPDVRPLLTGTG